jgi:hypothetical protein
MYSESDDEEIIKTPFNSPGLISNKQIFSFNENMEWTDNDILHIVEPVVENIVEPVVENIVEPVVENIVEPVVENIVEPVIEPVVENIVEPVIEPVIEQEETQPFIFGSSLKKSKQKFNFGPNKTKNPNKIATFSNEQTKKDFFNKWNKICSVHHKDSDKEFSESDIEDKELSENTEESSDSESDIKNEFSASDSESDIEDKVDTQEIKFMMARDSIIQTVQIESIKLPRYLRKTFLNLCLDRIDDIYQHLKLSNVDIEHMLFSNVISDTIHEITTKPYVYLNWLQITTISSMSALFVVCCQYIVQHN